VVGSGRKRDRCCAQDSAWPRVLMINFCEDGNEPVGSVKVRHLLTI
jgi:hypothetical protein